MLDKTIVFTMKGTLAVSSSNHDSVQEIVIICTIFLRFEKLSLSNNDERKNVNNTEVMSRISANYLHKN